MRKSHYICDGCKRYLAVGKKLGWAFYARNEGDEEFTKVAINRLLDWRTLEMFKKHYCVNCYKDILNEN